MNKRVGLLAPVSALVNRFGIGDFGKETFQFIDILAQHHIKTWQILPLNPLGYGHSPYQPLSSLAGDDIYLSLDSFVEEGLLNEEEIDFDFSLNERVYYEQVKEEKEKLYQIAFSRFHHQNLLQDFVKENPWVYDYALYRVFKRMNQNKAWTQWSQAYKDYPKNKNMSVSIFEKEIEYHIFLQYQFYKQWSLIKNYANEKGITIIGDMPIYVGLDSVDVWMNQENFLLNEDGSPSFVAGVPPDYFSQYGQRWGNPLYDWDYLEKNHFDFWVQRIQIARRIYDTIRIDHFRAFDTYWKIPASEPTAIVGKWIEAPGYALFDTLFKKIKGLSILAEDLGELRDEVYDLRDHYHLKGMYVFQFHFQQEFDFDKVVVYSGTHDNDTLVGWLSTLNEKQKEELDLLLSDYKEKEDYLKIIHYCLDLKGENIIIPFWDLLGLQSDSRMNTPGMINDTNWTVRMHSYHELTKKLDILVSMRKDMKK